MRKDTISKVITMALLATLFTVSMISWKNTYSVSAPGSTYPGQWKDYFINGCEYSSLDVEIDWFQDAPPNASALDVFKKRAETHLDKPGGINIFSSDKLGGPDRNYTYSLSDIRRIEERNRDYRADPWSGRLSLYILYVNGWYRDSDGSAQKLVLGMTYTASSIVIFRDPIWSKENPATACKKETAVLVHELGHVLGLVNIGYTSPYDHEHSTPTNINGTYFREYDNHCNDTNCVMYPEIEKKKDNSTAGYTYATDFCKNCTGDINLHRTSFCTKVFYRYIFLSMCIVSATAIVLYTLFAFRKRPGDASAPNRPPPYVVDESV